MVDMWDWEVSGIGVHDSKFPPDNKELILKKNKKEVTVSPPTN